jgi:hypothetical protein
MMKFKFLAFLLIANTWSYAQYTSSVVTNLSELSFSKKDNYDVISFTDRNYTSKVSEPQLPVKTLSFVIPVDQKVSSITINNKTGQQLSGTYNVMPVQKPVPLNMALPLSPVDQPNPAIYNSTSPYPGVSYKIVNDGFPMGYHVVTIEFYPVEYIPASKILKLYTTINFTINYTANTANVLLPVKQNFYSSELSKDYIKGLVANPNDVNTVSGGAREIKYSTIAATSTNAAQRGMNPTTLNVIPDYIIITDQTLVSAFQPLADWKTQKGVNTIIVKTQDIYANYGGYDNAEKIRNYLKDAWVNFGCHYILLGGDAYDNSQKEFVPARRCPVYYSYLSLGTDFYFSTVQGNWNGNGNSIFGEDADNADKSPVFQVGRAPVTTVAGATNFVNKVLTYEKMNNAGTANKAYVKNTAFFAGDDYCSTTFQVPEHLNTGTDNLLKISDGYHTLKVYNSYGTRSGTAELNKANTINAMKTGWSSFGQSWGNVHLMYHCDHSNPTTMGVSSCKGETVNKQDMDALTNGAAYPQIFYSDGCDPNQFTVDCIGKHYVNNVNAGCVAFLGNTDAGLWGDDTRFESDFAGTLYDITRTGYYNNKNFHIGYLNLYAASTNNSDFFRLKNRVLLGEPEMMVWTNTPVPLTVSGVAYSATNKNITGTVSGLAVNANVMVTICAWKGTEIYSTVNVAAAASSVAFTIPNAFADTPGNIILTATAHNYIPNISTISVLSPIAGAHPYMNSFTLSDDKVGASIGNNDQQPDAGETVEMLMNVINSGNASAATVTGTLVWNKKSFQPAGMITIPTATSSFGTIAAGATGNNNSAPFVFKVDNNAFNGITPRPLTQFANFTLTIKINGIAFATKTFDVQIAEPNLEKGENKVTWVSGGGANSLYIKLYNKGFAQATGRTTPTPTGLQATLTCYNTTNVNVSVPAATYNNINYVNSTTNFGSNVLPFKFNMKVSPYNYAGELFKLVVTNEFGRTWTFDNFKLTPFVNPANSITHLGYETSIQLNWTVSSATNVKGYNIYRLIGGTYTQINASLVPFTSYLDEGLPALTAQTYKITTVDVDGNESDFYPAAGYIASTSLNPHSGWPQFPTQTSNEMGTRAEASPNVYDADGDGTKEIFFTTSLGVWGFKHDASRWMYVDHNVTNTSGIINFNNNNTYGEVAIADMENDGKPELLVTTASGSDPNVQLKVNVYNPMVDVSPVDQTPDLKFKADGLGWEMNQGATFADLDNDGKLETVHMNLAGGIHVNKSDGTPYKSWPSSQDYTGGYTMPVAYDIDNNHLKEIIVGCNNSPSHPAGIYIFKDDGSNFATNPVYTCQAGFRADFPPVLADVDNDGVPEIVFTVVKDYLANIYAMKTSAPFTLLPGWNETTHPTFTLTNKANGTPSDPNDGYFSLACPPIIVGDLNKDGNIEVVTGDNGHLYIWNNAGTLVRNITVPGMVNSQFRGVLIADVDADASDLEVIATATIASPGVGTNICAFKMSGASVGGFPISIPEAILNTPCIDDIDNASNGKNELIVTTYNKFYVWNTAGTASNNEYGWTSYRRDNLKSGIFLKDEYIQNITISADKNYLGKTINAGYDVTTKKAVGNVIINNNAKVTMKAVDNVILKNNVDVQAGCVFEIK